jgi:heptosyltransferase-2
VILATAVLEKFHSYYPFTKLDILVRKGNESLLKDHPFINEVLIWDKKSNKYANSLKIISRIRSNKYDLVINLQRFMMSGLFTVLSGAKSTRGFKKNPMSRLFDKKYNHVIGKDIHEVDRNNSLIADITDNLRNLPKLYPSNSDFQKITPGLSYVCIAPTSVWFTKQWPTERWLTLIEHLNSDHEIYLLGAPSDFEACENIRTLSNRNNVFNMAGKLSFLESAALMQSAKMNFVNDSAPLHMCTAVGAPVLAIYCSTVPDFGFYPIGLLGRYVETELVLECRPCGLHGYATCPRGHFNCSITNMTDIKKTLADFTELFNSDTFNELNAIV